jgi:hypothetical protein
MARNACTPASREPGGAPATARRTAEAGPKPCGQAQPATDAAGPGVQPALARRIGNRGVQQLLQAKLAIGSTDDPLEREADRVADQVLAGSGAAHAAAAPLQPLQIQRAAAAPPAQAGAAPASVERVLAGAGRPLGAALRQDMEQRFGHDFSQVRIHQDAAAAHSARDVQAQAYTVGSHIVFGAGSYAPGTRAGQHLIAHELAHVVQQGAGVLRRRYRLPELQSAVSSVGTGHLVNGTPPALFYPGSAANTADRKAFVVAGIHGTEDSAIALGAEIESELAGGALVPDFHTLLVPRANPGTGRGTANVPDLNREYGGSAPSPEPIAGEIQSMVTEFEPERILSIHAVSEPALGGMFLDPVRAPGSAPGPVGSAARRAAAFTHDARNQAGMTLTEEMIDEVRGSGVPGAAGATPGNTPGSLPLSRGPARFPASRHPGAGAGASRYNLLYPQQNQVGTGPLGETSLGVWAAQLPFAPAVITLEVPGYAVRRGGRNWRPFLPAVRRFLRLAAAAPAPSPAPAPVPAPPARSGGSGAVLRRVPLTEADLSRRRGIPFAFMQEVYRRQVALWTAAGASYTHEVPGRDRVSLASGDVITGRSVSVHRDIATAVRNLLRDARTDLAAAGSAASGVTGLAVRSGYRSATDQFSIWEREFPRYYRDTATARAALSGGAHGSAAAQLLAEYVNQRVFSPGYSPHQRGRTIDFSYQSATEWPRAGSHWAEADSSATGIATWSASWFYGWLRGNAGRYGFAENPAIREPWHWEWSPPRSSWVRRIIDLLRRLWRLILRWLGVEPPPDEEEAPDTPEPPVEDPGAAGPREPGR